MKHSRSIVEMLTRGIAAHQQGRIADAERAYLAVLKIERDAFDALHLLGVIRWQQQRHSEAATLIERAVRINPRSAEAMSNLALVLQSLGRDIEAIALCDRALAIAPHYVKAHYNRGNALRAAHRFAEALASYDEAHALDPGNLDVLLNRGVALKALGRTAEALESYDKALALSPRHPEALYNRANSLHALGRHEEALASYDKALSFKPQDPEIHYKRAETLEKLERDREAIESYQHAHALGHPHAPGARAYYQLSICKWDQIEELRAALPLRIATGGMVEPMIAMAFGLSPIDQFKAAKRYVEHILPAAAKRATSDSRDFQRGGSRERARSTHRGGERLGKIRIAYLSSDFRSHPVGYLTAELFERHDRTRFHVIGVSLSADDGSEIRSRLSRSFDEFHDVTSETDRSVAQRMVDLGVHIAIDLNGHTGGARPGILACRPAPVQASYLGYAGTTGARFIDYAIADATALPFDQQPYYSEKIVHLPDSFFVYDSTRQLSSRLPTRREGGLPEDALVLCCFNRSYKLTAPIFDIWMRLLAAVDGSVLWLSRTNELTKENLRREAGSRGVDAGRLVFAPRVDLLEEHLARLRLADLFLDTLPYNAHATAIDALRAGVPIITCRGDAFAGRIGASLLTAIGLKELVTANLAEYEALALRLGTDSAMRQSFRRKLGDNQANSALFDTDRLRRHIEAAYDIMWERCRRGERPQSFRVEPLEVAGAAMPRT
jgi:protein O-GlcNAc transferase